MAKFKFFVAGTDTDVGKTAVATGLLVAANQQGLSTVAMKPVAAGCHQTEQGLRNDDALQLQAAMSHPLPYEQVNPIALQPAIAPHIAAQQAGRRLAVSQLAGYCRGVLMRPVDLAIIEGAGGWRVPINRTETLADLARELQLPVLLVVGIKLGCINHALLTAEVIRSDGLPLVGWVANCRDAEMPACQENIAALTERLPAPCIGVIPALAKPEPSAIAGYLSLSGVITG